MYTFSFSERSNLRCKNALNLGSYMLWIFGLILVLGACSGGPDNGHGESEKPKEEKVLHSLADDLKIYSKKRGVIEKNVVKGFIENKSTDVSYSNIVVKVNFHDKDDALILSEQLKLNESIPPQEMQKIILDLNFPEGTTGYRIELISADVLPQN